MLLADFFCTHFAPKMFAPYAFSAKRILVINIERFSPTYYDLKLNISFTNPIDGLNFSKYHFDCKFTNGIV